MALLCAVGVEVALGLLGELVEVGVLVFGGHGVWVGGVLLGWVGLLRSGGYVDEGYRGIGRRWQSVMVKLCSGIRAFLLCSHDYMELRRWSYCAMMMKEWNFGI